MKYDGAGCADRAPDYETDRAEFASGAHGSGVNRSLRGVLLPLPKGAV
jgi:hypothetical protein